jgi:hypothetical protein
MMVKSLFFAVKFLFPFSRRIFFHILLLPPIRKKKGPEFAA